MNQWVWSNGGTIRTREGRSTGRDTRPNPVPLCPPQISFELTWNRSRISVVRSQATARPINSQVLTARCSMTQTWGISDSTRHWTQKPNPNTGHGSWQFHRSQHTRWFKYDRDKLWLVYTQIVPVIFEPPCTTHMYTCTVPVCTLSSSL